MHVSMYTNTRTLFHLLIFRGAWCVELQRASGRRGGDRQRDHPRHPTHTPHRQRKWRYSFFFIPSPTEKNITK